MYYVYVCVCSIQYYEEIKSFLFHGQLENHNLIRKLLSNTRSSPAKVIVPEKNQKRPVG